MHLSISSSNQRLPSLPWKPILVGAFLIFAAFVAVMELKLAAKGFRPSVIDSEELWQTERARASALGERALILIGGSRMQLGMDLNVLRRSTGFEPVQLAIDASTPLPILEGLARDPNIRGTVIIDYYDQFLEPAGENDPAKSYETRFEQTERQQMIDYTFVESYLANRLRVLLRSYADGARPLTTLLTRIFQTSTPQYLISLPDRSRLADYQMVSMPTFYYKRVMRNLGLSKIELPDQATCADVEHILSLRVKAIQPVDNSVYKNQLGHLESLIQSLQKRGSRIFVVVMPTSGLIREIEKRTYPKLQFWDKFVAQTSARTIHFEDFPTLRDFRCPDGSHLDFRDRARYTQALVKVAGLNRN